jgi:hypothetical protein
MTIMEKSQGNQSEPRETIGPKLSEVWAGLDDAGKRRLLRTMGGPSPDPISTPAPLPYAGLGEYWGGFWRFIGPWAERDLWQQFERRDRKAQADAARARAIEAAKAAHVESGAGQ